RPVRHGDLGAALEAGLGHPLQPVGRRPPGVHPAVGAARADEAQPGRALGGRPRPAGLGKKMPDGVILGARGAYGLMSPQSDLNDWWFKGYEKANGVYPV